MLCASGLVDREKKTLGDWPIAFTLAFLSLAGARIAGRGTRFSGVVFKS